MKCLADKHKKMSLILLNCQHDAAFLECQKWENRKRRIIDFAGKLVYLNQSKRPCPKTKMESNRGRLIFMSDLHIHIDTHAHIHMNSCTKYMYLYNADTFIHDT